jgi:hypothetical protein
MKINKYKVRIYNEADDNYRYPDSTGSFYAHHLANNQCILDNVKLWPPCNHYQFVQAVLQHCIGQDIEHNDIYVGNIKIFEIAHPTQHLIWSRALQT